MKRQKCGNAYNRRSKRVFDIYVSISVSCRQVYGSDDRVCRRFAAAARLGISLGEMMDEIHIIPASYDVRDTVGTVEPVYT
ncbi:MAG: hypothetical protein ACLRI8_11905 [Agathobacter rectalis]